MTLFTVKITFAFILYSRILITEGINMRIFIVALIAAVTSMSAQAAPDESKMFGGATPFSIDEIPNGRLKSQLQFLPPAARERGMAWLNSFSFPANDVAHLHVDGRGAVFYQDTILPDEISQTDLQADPTLEGINPTDAFKLHSKPGAANVVYVNFKGYAIENTAWNYNAQASYQAKPFNKDADPSSFSDAERKDIGEIWHRIAEDLSAFDVDVTTEAPTAFGPKVGHILITSNSTVSGGAMPHNNAGGVAYVGVWGYSNYEYYQPALVYYDQLSSSATYISEAASHELGHNLALSHDGTSTVGYYTGHGSGLSSWAPIMGVGYYQNITQWSKGEYTDANNTQDDLAIIAARLSYSQDDHANNAASSTALIVDSAGNIASSNPEFDPLNARPDNKGVIESGVDTDVFFFDTAAGEVNITITPAWAAYTRSSRRGANLDIKATLTDGAGISIVDDYLADTEALITANVAAGRYYLEITGVGNSAAPYSAYGSLGEYFIVGQVVPLSADMTAPNPDPMSWLSAPTGIDRTSINMAATVATDDSGFVEYQFVCTTGGLGCTASAWQTSSSYMASGLEAGTAYSYKVKARDTVGNETALSAVASASTWSNVQPVGVYDSVEVDKNANILIDVLANDSDSDGDALQVYSVSMVAANGDAVISGSKILYTPDTNFVGIDTFNYVTTDGFGGYSENTEVTINVLDVNSAPVANPDIAEVLLVSSVVIDVLANDTDPEGNSLNVVSVTNGAKGTTTNNADGTVTYTAANKKRGGDTFSYTVSDGGLTSTTTVSVSIVKSLSGDDGGDGGSSGGGGRCHPKRGC